MGIEMRGGNRSAIALAIVCASLSATIRCAQAPSPEGPPQRTFATPEEAVQTLADTVKKGSISDVVAIFGADGRELIDSSDPATARRNQEVFSVAISESWRLIDEGSDRRTLVIGNEEWPFPVPLVKQADRWRFDTAAGKEEVIARRIGRNELAVMQVCRTYVAAQRIYALRAHDGKQAGLYARTVRSDPGRQNGLYWAAARGERPSPLGELMTAAERNANDTTPTPFHGYFFRILTAQGPAARGGAKDYIANGELSGGFALIAWPAQYDVTGVMTFIVNHEGVVYEKDLGPETDVAAAAIKAYDPDSSWVAAGDPSLQKGGPVDKGAGTLTAARKYLEGRWRLLSFEIMPPGEAPIKVLGAGTLLYDNFGNLNIEIRIDEPTARQLHDFGIPSTKGAISTSGRTAIDLQAHTLTYILEGQRPFDPPGGPLALSRPRHWALEGNVLTLTTKGSDGKPLSVGRWEKAQ